MNYLKIPGERIAVLIGENGKTKRDIEEKTHTILVIEESVVTIDSEPENSFMELTAKDIVLAVGRGFNPVIAMNLLNENNILEIIQLNNFFHTKKSAARIKGRIIGREGRTKKFIQQITGCYISVYGKTVAIIGRYDDVHLAREAIDMLLSGSKHSSVYKFLERKRHEQMEDRRRAMAW
ncbi:hypothetical protein BEH94_08915 [Candidatus Altiarchaeales archaeon WOR_SM1_SCG]|nr:hypothetical protein BEH94_08915 [Candidatus Altiarchaeales archaeon WOR_SM1_SCG]